MTEMPPTSSLPWAPEDLPIAAEESASWSYVVLEDIVDGTALLRRWPWPVADPLGRLLWVAGAEHDTESVAADVALLTAQLYAPNGVERQPRPGDTFAVPRQPVEHWRTTHLRDLRAVLGDGTIYDISADAREAAKIAYQSSLGAIAPARAVDGESTTASHEELQRRAGSRLLRLRLGPPPSTGPQEVPR